MARKQPFPSITLPGLTFQACQWACIERNLVPGRHYTGVVSGEQGDPWRIVARHLDLTEAQYNAGVSAGNLLPSWGWKAKLPHHPKGGGNGFLKLGPSAQMSKFSVFRRLGGLC